MKKRVLVLGAGFGGLEFSTLLSETLSDDVEVTLIDKGAFLDALTDHAKRKPDTVAGTFVEDVAERTVPGYTRGNFYDQMKSGDPFDKSHRGSG